MKKIIVILLMCATCVTAYAEVTSLKSNDYDEFVKICESGSLSKFKEKYAKLNLSPNAMYLNKAWGGNTLLAIAAERSPNADIVKFLLNEGAEVNTRGEKVNPPLIRATCNKRNPREIVQTLIQAGANVNAQDDGDWTPLMMAATRNYSEVIDILLQAGANVHLKDGMKDTALIYAAQDASVSVVKKLLNAGAKINEQNEIGETALIKAAGQNSAEVVELLLDAGADANLEATSEYDDDTYRAIDIAQGNPKLKGTRALNRLKAATKPQTFTPNASIAGNKVNVRTNPNTSSKVVKQLNAGHPVKVTSETHDLQWFYIQTASGTRGWVFGKYLKFKK